MDGITLITGGAGFIGSNYADRCISRGERVVIFDNLSRHGAKTNLDWLRQKHGEKSFQLVVGDVRHAEEIKGAAREASRIVHLAAQVAVTTSVTDPRNDFEINAIGTFNTLEAARLSGNHPSFVYSSTNKVYGGMENVKVIEKETRYDYADLPLGASEEQILDFHSPYGCSKGTGDQYVRDYARIYDLPTTVFRQSCIYGLRQFGVEDQGWVAWFIIAAITGHPISIYGNGKQVRDILFVDDLLNAYDAALQHPDKAAGQIFNVGGGRENTISVWLEFAPMLEKLLGKKIEVSWGDWRPGDQPVYISDIRKAQRVLGWSPKISAQEGITRLFNWVKENRSLF
ncbi:MAG: NAD-dependent epimerase/dehydratase family protein [Anaerolineaceae bacterium]|nr:NAD-dependent epimerase/dehydratase family protein [Anaerolineaceae bacterium]